MCLRGLPSLKFLVSGCYPNIQTLQLHLNTASPSIADGHKCKKRLGPSKYWSGKSAYLQVITLEKLGTLEKRTSISDSCHSAETKRANTKQKTHLPCYHSYVLERILQNRSGGDFVLNTSKWSKGISRRMRPWETSSIFNGMLSLCRKARREHRILGVSNINLAI